MVIDQIVAELRYIQKEPKITNFASSTTNIVNSSTFNKIMPLRKEKEFVAIVTKF